MITVVDAMAAGDITPDEAATITGVLEVRRKAIETQEFAERNSEPVLPAYLIGMVLAGTVGRDHELIRRLRTLTFGLLMPFYFINWLVEPKPMSDSLTRAMALLGR